MLTLSAFALATEVGVVGLFPGKAVVVINNGRPRTITQGIQTAEGVKLVATEGDKAIFEFDGKRQSMGIGQHVFVSAAAEAVSLKADSRGHFLTAGSINGTSVRFLVDTGATFISLGASDAKRAGIDFSKGKPTFSNTANGRVRVWLVKLDSVKVGAITLNDVDASVLENDLPLVLLGMSFLKRMDMQRNGETMALKKIY